MANKMTKKDAFTQISAILAERGETELVEIVNHEIELIESRSHALKKPTENQIANEKLMEKIFDFICEREQTTIAELMDAFTEIKSNQHCNSLLIKLRKEGKVESFKIKKTTYFKQAGQEDEENDTVE